MHAEFLAASDCKPVAQAFIGANRPGLRHMFSSLEDQLRPDGACMLPQHANCTKQLNELQPDIMSVGGICQPFSRARFKTGSTAKTGSSDVHPGYETTLEMVPLLLDMRKPRIFILEEVNDFDSRRKGVSETACDTFVKSVMSSGWFTGMAKLSMDVSVFNQSSRSRLYLAFFCSELGGQQGADMWRQRCVHALYSIERGGQEPLIGGTLSAGEIKSVQLQALFSNSRAVALIHFLFVLLTMG